MINIQKGTDRQTDRQADREIDTEGDITLKIYKTYFFVKRNIILLFQCFTAKAARIFLFFTIYNYFIIL